MHDGAGALDWYVAALGPTEIGVVAANSSEGSSCALHVNVPDCDAAHELAVSNGATSLSEPGDQPHGARSATILDPYGHRWMLSHQISRLNHDEINAKYDNAEVVPAPGDE